MSLNSYNITKLSLVYGLFNQYLFNEAKSNIDLVERYYMTDPSTMDNTLIRALIDAIRKYDFEAIDEPVFKSILSTEKKTDSEAKDILEEIIKYKCYDQKQIDPVRNYLRSICYQSIISQANSRFKNDPQGFVNFLKASDYHADYSNVLSTCSFNDLVLSPDDLQMTGGWSSTMSLINNSYKPLNKWKSGQLVSVTAPPGCFTGDTKVRLTDGTSMSLSEISERCYSEDIFVFCKRSDGSVHPTKVRACWVSKKTDDLVKVTYDNGESDICTPDHEYLLRDGSYRAAENLAPGTSISSDWTRCEYRLSDLYNAPENYVEFLNLPGYLIYKITNRVNGKSYIGDTKRDLQWRLFDHYCGAHFDMYDDSSVNIHLYNAMRKYGLENFTIRILTFDNTLTEKYYIDYYDTFNSGYNESRDGKGWGSVILGRIAINDGKKNKLIKPEDLDYWMGLGDWVKGRINPGMRDRVAITNETDLKRVPEDSVDYWISKGWRRGVPKYLIDSKNSKMKSDGTGFYDHSVSSRAGKISAELNRLKGTNVFDPEVRRKGQINGLKSQELNGTGIYDRSPESVRKRVEKSVRTNSINRTGSCHNPELQSSMRDLATRSAANKRVATGIRILDELLEEGLPITESNYESRRRLVHLPSSNTTKWTRLVEKLTLDQKIKYGIDNHKVVSVERYEVDEEIQVYDLNVEDDSHNFMLDSEVFVKNCGKTLFLMQEELGFCLQGARVHHLALGDMKESDFIFRMAAIYSGLPFDQAATNIGVHLQNLKKVIGDKLSLTCVPSATVTAEQYLEYMRPKLDQYDVLVCDYDANFLTNGQNSIYTEGGLLYDRLTEFSQRGKLVFVASQPKIYAYSNEEIPMEALAESSRKSQIVDAIITIGRCPNTPNHIGVMKIAKNRRGEVGDKSHYIRLSNGRFRLISSLLYSEIKNLPMKRNYLDGDIDAMERQVQVSSMKQ